MSATIETIITCDGYKKFCDTDGCYADGDARHLSASEQRKEYGDAGWVYYRGKDYCPTCAKQLVLSKKRMENIKLGFGK